MLLKMQEGKEIQTIYLITIFDNRVQDNTGILRFRHARTVQTPNYERYRKYVNLAEKGRFNFSVSQITTNKDGKVLSMKVTTYDPKYGEFETIVK